MSRKSSYRVYDEWLKSIQPIHVKLSKEIRRLIDKGYTVDQAVNQAVAKFGYADILAVSIYDSMGEIVKVTSRADDIGKRSWWLNKLWPDESLTLSQRVNQVSRMADIKDVIKAAMRDQRSWSGLAVDLSRQNLTKADLAEHARRLETAARRVMLGGTPEDFAEYRKALNNSIRQVDRLVKTNAPKDRLRKAYQNLIVKSTQLKSEEALDKAMDRLIRAKENYNAGRIARTEIAKAYAQGIYNEVLNDSQVTGIQYVLGSRHPAPDVCDFHTGANLFGMGRGIYPLDKLPPYPFHQNCMCQLLNFYGPVKTGANVGQSAKKYLSQLSDSKQKSLLGVGGAEVFKQNPGKWPSVLRNYKGHRHLNELLERKLEVA